MDDRDTPAAVLELQAGTNQLGTWLVTTQSDQVQPLSAAGRSYALALRSKRHYTPYSLTLIDCQHDVYKGTDIPRNFSSRVRIQDPRSQEDREVLVYMNNPLRYQGNTYYQYQMDPRQAAAQWSTLQVVRNPSWLTPYVACILVGVGLVIQFLAHLIGFLRERTS
jgi:cytochrome c biogenesis protein ResB